MLATPELKRINWHTLMFGLNDRSLKTVVALTGFKY